MSKFLFFAIFKELRNTYFRVCGLSITAYQQLFYETNICLLVINHSLKKQFLYSIIVFTFTKDDPTWILFCIPRRTLVLFKVFNPLKHHNSPANIVISEKPPSFSYSCKSDYESNSKIIPKNYFHFHLFL